MNTITEIEKHINGRAVNRARRERSAELFDWEELNRAIDKLCAEFKAALQPHRE